MFFLFAEETGKAAEETAEQVPIIVKLVNQYFGEYAYNFEIRCTKPLWAKLLAKFGATPDAAFGLYTPEDAIAWYTMMFVIACLLSVALIGILKGRVAVDGPCHGLSA